MFSMAFTPQRSVNIEGVFPERHLELIIPNVGEWMAPRYEARFSRTDPELPAARRSRSIMLSILLAIRKTRDSTVSIIALLRLLRQCLPLRYVKVDLLFLHFSDSSPLASIFREDEVQSMQKPMAKRSKILTKKQSYREQLIYASKYSSSRHDNSLWFCVYILKKLEMFNTS
jgi:hypothetical protein